MQSFEAIIQSDKVAEEWGEDFQKLGKTNLKIT